MKYSLFSAALLTLVIFSGCVPTASDTSGLTKDDVLKIVQTELEKAGPTDGSGLSESDVQQLVQEEINALNVITEDIVDELISEKVPSAASGLSDDQLEKKIEAGIEEFVKKQEEEMRKAQEEANKPQKVENVSADDDPFLGDANAPVTIIEFSDFECPFCKRHVENVYPKIKEKYIDTGKVKYVFRDLPLGFHQNAIPAAVAANCAREQSDDETYFAYHDKLFENQESLDTDTYKDHAEDLDLDMNAFEACLEQNDTAEIEADMEEGSQYGVSGTPGFFINGWQIKGAYPYEEFEKYIEQELSAS